MTNNIIAATNSKIGDALEMIEVIDNISAQNARQISDSLKSLIENIRSASQASHETITDFSHVMDFTDEVVSAFSEINHSTRELSAGSREMVDAQGSLINISEAIKGGSREILAGIGQIQSSIEKIETRAGENREGSEKIGNTIADLTLELNTLANQFIENNSIGAQQDHLLSEKCWLNGQKRESHKLTLSEFSNILLKHQTWVSRIRSILDGKMDFDKALIVDCDHCDLGVWLNAHGRRLLDDATLKILIENHEKFHDAIKEIHSAMNRESGKELHYKYLEVIELSSRILSLLRTNKSKIVSE